MPKVITFSYYYKKKNVKNRMHKKISATKKKYTKSLFLRSKQNFILIFNKEYVKANIYCYKNSDKLSAITKIKDYFYRN